ncbi:hypothetical protein N0V83_000932 [Neocucurbitaria cava]|uniref:Uncharacterized protein n=1 Tax=Neocucurbitaria cava TaxID=798079 RepID=A0A9W8YHB7_9PLEO|nr:hypothetical protein N0V83_000932 [Neocucurbitaria cava]
MSWYKDRGVPKGYSSIRQFRPTYRELKVLQRMGLIKNEGARGKLIVPNMLHPLVRSFYDKKPSPQSLNTKLTLIEAMPKSSMGQGVITKHAEPQLSTPGEARLSRTIVKSSLDPRLQTRFGSNSSFLTEGEQTEPILTSVAMPYNAQENAKTNNSTLEDKAETKLQELEDQVMKLHMDNIAKDREIRRLRAELAELRGEGYERGKKRPRN